MSTLRVTTAYHDARRGQFMKVYIFGAGASRGSQPEHMEPTRRAPLVDELFEDFYKNCARYVGLSEADLVECRIGSKQSGGVEKWLTDEWESISHLRQEHTKQAKRLLFARLAFYIWRLLLDVSATYNESNGYNVFANKLFQEDEPFGLVSFNYDLLLDRAIKYRYGAPLSTIDDYLGFNFAKPHGSVNWLLAKRDEDPVPGNEATRDIPFRISLASSRLFNGATIPIANLHVIPPDHADLLNPDNCFSRVGYYFFPLVLMPLTSKMDFVIQFSDLILRSTQDMLSKADAVYLIGYRANDDIVKEMFKALRPGTTLHIVGWRTAEEVASRILGWATNLKKGTTYNDGFMDFVGKM